MFATGRNCSVRDFVTSAFAAADIKIEWRGKGPTSRASRRRSGKVRVKVNPQFFRPAEVETLLNAASARTRSAGSRRPRSRSWRA